MKTKLAATSSNLSEIEACLERLRDRIDGITSFDFGSNTSPEGLGRGYDLGFTLDFVDAAARDAYLPHPAHQECVALIGASVENVLVFDYEF